MLSSKSNECLGFDSKWEVKKVYSESGAQTTEFSASEIATSTNKAVETEVQTAKEEPRESKEVDMDKLANWLAEIYPSVEKNLNEAINSKAFTGYFLMDEREHADASYTQCISLVNHNDGDKNLNVHALSWNKTGNTLAVATSGVHKNWCHHGGEVKIFTFKRDDTLHEIPNKKLTTRSCVINIKFHPSLPSVFACGLFSGEVVLWNTQYDGEEALVTEIHAHQEKITEISWICDIDNKNSYLLATSSLDGFLILWNCNVASSSLTIKQKHCIKSPVLAKSQRTKDSDNSIEKIIRGISSFDFSSYITDMFVVGVEGGLVIQCSLLGAHTLDGSTTAIPVLDPVFKYYESHEGEIHTVRFSPNRKEMFMTCATDDEIRIYLIGQDAPAQVIFLEKPLYHVGWVPYQEQLLVGCGEKGLLEIFHLVSGRSIPDICSKKPNYSILLHVEVNKRRCNLAVVGNDRGEMQLWTVPWELFSSKKIK